MAVVKELIRTEENGGISFGNYELPAKSKVLKRSPNWNVMECLYMSPYREQPYFL